MFPLSVVGFAISLHTKMAFTICVCIVSMRSFNSKRLSQQEAHLIISSASKSISDMEGKDSSNS